MRPDIQVKKGKRPDIQVKKGNDTRYPGNETRHQSKKNCNNTRHQGQRMKYNY